MLMPIMHRHIKGYSTIMGFTFGAFAQADVWNVWLTYESPWYGPSHTYWQAQDE